MLLALVMYVITCNVLLSIAPIGSLRILFIESTNEYVEDDVDALRLGIEKNSASTTYNHKPSFNEVIEVLSFLRYGNENYSTTVLFCLIVCSFVAYEWNTGFITVALQRFGTQKKETIARCVPRRGARNCSALQKKIVVVVAPA